MQNDTNTSLPSEQELNSKIWLTPDDLYNEFGITKRQQTTMRCKNYRKRTGIALPFTKFGKRVFYRRESIYNWLSENEIKGIKYE